MALEGEAGFQSLRRASPNRLEFVEGLRVRLILLLSLLGLGGCEEGDASGRPCEGQTEYSIETPDGCNTCRVCGEDYWECTTLACSGPGYSTKRGCFLQPCVTDMDEATPGLQANCSVGVEFVEGGMTPLSPCAGTQQEPELPDGVTSCFNARVGDALSASCVDQGAALEFEFLTDWGGRAEDPGNWGPVFWVHCEAPSFLEWYYEDASCWGPGPAVETWEW